MTVVGNYELVAQLATGGMAETHVARSLVDGSIVVIKQLLGRYAGNAEFVEMFVDEGRVISSLHHPNIVTLHEFGFHEELPFLAMEYLHGVDLRTLSRTLALRRKEHVPLESAIYIAMCMCAGLHHAHDARTIDGKPMDITHRDVSPQNVVLTFEGEVKLIDFGIATARGRMHETRSGALKGKIPYMAPEQVRAGATDRRTDIYATGIVLYELLTARRPYAGKHAKLGEFSLMMAIVNHEIIPLDAITHIPPPLAKVVMKAIASEPARRYQTGLEMHDALRDVAALLGIPVSRGHLESLLVNVFGSHRIVKAPRTSDQVRELVSTIEDVKTKVDESHDPSTIEQSELTPIAPTGRISATQREVAPVFEDIVIEHDPDRTAPIVDKTIEANLTRLRFHRSVDAGFRWGRLFDGIEGIVELDFGGLAELTSPSITAASEAVRSLGDEVSEIRLIAVPIMLAMELEDRCRVVSVTCRGRCPSCREVGASILSYDELRSRLAAGAEIPCMKCGTGLIEIELGRSEMRTPSGPMPIVVGPRTSIRMLVAQPQITGEQAAVTPPDDHAIAPPAAAAITHPPQVISGSQQFPPAPASKSQFGFFAGIVIVGVAIGVLVGVLWQKRAQRPASDPAVAAAVPSPDDWTIEVEAEGATDVEVLAALHLKAVRAAVAKIESELPERVRGLAAKPLDRPVMSLDIAPSGRFDLEQRTIAWTRGATTKANARFALAPPAHARLRSHFSEISKVNGVELVNAPPSRVPGVVVLSVPEGTKLAVGDRIVAVGGKRITDLADITTLAGEVVVEHLDVKTVAVP